MTWINAAMSLLIGQGQLSGDAGRDEREAVVRVDSCTAAFNHCASIDLWGRPIACTVCSATSTQQRLQKQRSFLKANSPRGSCCKLSSIKYQVCLCKHGHCSPTAPRVPQCMSQHRHPHFSDKFSSTWADSRLRSMDDDDDMHLPGSKQRLKISFKAAPSHGGGGENAASAAAIAEAATSAVKATNIEVKIEESQQMTSRDSRGKINIKSFPSSTTSPAPQADSSLVLTPVFTLFSIHSVTRPLSCAETLQGPPYGTFVFRLSEIDDDLANAVRLTLKSRRSSASTAIPPFVNGSGKKIKLAAPVTASSASPIPSNVSGGLGYKSRKHS